MLAFGDTFGANNCPADCGTITNAQLQAANGGGTAAAVTTHVCRPGEGACKIPNQDCRLSPVPTSADCTSECGVRTNWIMTPKHGGGAPCGDLTEYQCKPGDGACPAAKKGSKAKAGQVLTALTPSTKPDLFKFLQGHAGLQAADTVWEKIMCWSGNLADKMGSHYIEVFADDKCDRPHGLMVAATTTSFNQPKDVCTPHSDKAKLYLDRYNKLSKGKTDAQKEEMNSPMEAFKTTVIAHSKADKLTCPAEGTVEITAFKDDKCEQQVGDKQSFTVDKCVKVPKTTMSYKYHGISCPAAASNKCKDGEFDVGGNCMQTWMVVVGAILIVVVIGAIVKQFSSNGNGESSEDGDGDKAEDKNLEESDFDSEFEPAHEAVKQKKQPSQQQQQRKSGEKDKDGAEARDQEEAEDSAEDAGEAADEQDDGDSGDKAAQSKVQKAQKTSAKAAKGTAKHHHQRHR